MPFTAVTTTLAGAIPTVVAAGALRRAGKWAKGDTRRRRRKVVKPRASVRTAKRRVVRKRKR